MAESPLVRILRSARDESAKNALAGAATGGAAMAQTFDPRLIASAAGVGAAMGAVGGAVLGAGVQLRREALPTSGELVEVADADATADATRAVPAIAARVDALERGDASTKARLEELTMALGLELQAAHRVRIQETTVEVGRTLLQLVADGHVQPEDVDSPEGRHAVTEAIRFALDALCPAAVPAIARLMRRPVDHFFRGACRVLVDLDATELAQLVALIAPAAHALPAELEPLELDPDADDGVVVAGLTTGERAIASVNRRRSQIHALTLRRVQRRGEVQTVRWKELSDVPEIPMRHTSPVLGLLRAHHLLRVATIDTTPQPTIGGGLSPTKESVDRIEIAHVFDLHFVLTGVRIVDPRGEGVVVRDLDG